MPNESPRNDSAAEWEKCRELIELDKFCCEHVIKAAA
jgi:hypothetical protein